ncbi:MAG: hypothetical protein V3S37_02810, partial [Dehalococcoidia bacterium]
MSLVRKLVTALLIRNRWGRLVFLTAVLAVLVSWKYAFLTEELYPTVRDDVLRAMGVGAIPAALWVTLTLGVMWLRRWWLRRWWRWWLSSALVVVAAQAVLGAVHGAEGILARETLGGQAGQALWGESYIRGIPTVAALVLLAQAILWPKFTYHEARGILRALNRALIFSMRSLRN